MTSEEIRRRLADRDIEALRACISERRDAAPLLSEMLGHLAEGLGERWWQIVDDAPLIARDASARLSLATEQAERTRNIQREDFDMAHDAFAGDARAAASSATDIACAGFGSDLLVTETPVATGKHRVLRPAVLDDALVASVLAAAIHDACDADAADSRENLRRLAPLLSDTESVVRDAWRARLHGHLPSMVRRARLLGYGASASFAKACVESVTATGKAMQGTASSEAVFALGVAALEATASGRASSGCRRPRVSALGAAALAAVYGFPSCWREAFPAHVGPALEPVDALSEFDRYDPSHAFGFVAYGLYRMRFSWGELEPLAVLTAESACERLDEIALSPLTEVSTARRYAVFADAVRHASADRPEHVAFARIIGIRESAPEEGELRDGERLHRAAPVGQRSAVITTRGRGGRQMRLHAAADGSGKLVGYAGLDPLSEEFHGVPERYVYSLDGWRRGRLVDGIYRKGNPRVKMMTAPEGIEMPVTPLHLRG